MSTRSSQVPASSYRAYQYSDRLPGDYGRSGPNSAGLSRHTPHSSTSSSTGGILISREEYDAHGRLISKSVRDKDNFDFAPDKPARRSTFGDSDVPLTRRRGDSLTSPPTSAGLRPLIHNTQAARSISPMPRNDRDYYSTAATSRIPPSSAAHHRRQFSVDSSDRPAPRSTPAGHDGDHDRRRLVELDRDRVAGQQQQAPRSARHSGRSYHLSGPAPRGTEFAEHDGYEYTNARGMFNDTEPIRRRRGSVDSGSRDAPYTAYGTAGSNYARTKDYDAPPSAALRAIEARTGGGVHRSGSLRDSGVRSPSRTRHATYSEDDDYKRRVDPYEDIYKDSPPRDRFNNKYTNPPSSARHVEDSDLQSRGFGIRSPTAAAISQEDIDDRIHQEPPRAYIEYEPIHPKDMKLQEVDKARENPRPRRVEQDFDDDHQPSRRAAEDKLRRDLPLRDYDSRPARPDENKRRERDVDRDSDYDRDRGNKRDVDRNAEYDRDRGNRRDADRDSDYDRERGNRRDDDSHAGRNGLLGAAAATAAAGGVAAAASHRNNKDRASDRSEDSPPPRRERQTAISRDISPKENLSREEPSRQQQQGPSRDQRPRADSTTKSSNSPPRPNDAPAPRLRPRADSDEDGPRRVRHYGGGREAAHAIEEEPISNGAKLNADDDFRKRMQAELERTRSIDKQPANEAGANRDQRQDRDRRRDDRDENNDGRSAAAAGIGGLAAAAGAGRALSRRRAESESDGSDKQQGIGRRSGGRDDREGGKAAEGAPRRRDKSSSDDERQKDSSKVLAVYDADVDHQQILDQPMVDEPAEVIENREKRVMIVEPPKGKELPKGILKRPTQNFPEDPNPIREGVAPHKDAKKPKDQNIPEHARWTKIDRRLVNPAALEEAKERFEEREDHVIVLRVLKKDSIQRLADRTAELRGLPVRSNGRNGHDQDESDDRHGRRHRDDRDHEEKSGSGSGATSFLESVIPALVDQLTKSKSSDGDDDDRRDRDRNRKHRRDRDYDY